LPENALAPLHPPDAMQAVAFWLDHERVVLPPALMVVELADKLNKRLPSGADGVLLLADTETEAERVMLPPAPLQVST
jgi:hypothetical protein